ncbi:MAG: hypothetical protein MZU91_13505 [Desulfosudis oleivorans]|nr:hypothetical protein [Desulfosudis oleivorans]
MAADEPKSGDAAGALGHSVSRRPAASWLHRRLASSGLCREAQATRDPAWSIVRETCSAALKRRPRNDQRRGRLSHGFSRTRSNAREACLTGLFNGLKWRMFHFNIGRYALELARVLV